MLTRRKLRRMGRPMRTGLEPGMPRIACARLKIMTLITQSILYLILLSYPLTWLRCDPSKLGRMHLDGAKPNVRNTNPSPNSVFTCPPWLPPPTTVPQD